MIQIEVKKKENKVKQINFKGHAMYDDFGRDIVCAGVSSILTTTVNAILMFDENAVIFEQKKDFVLQIQKMDDITSKLLENMLNLLKELGEQYPKNIQIREEEIE